MIYVQIIVKNMLVQSYPRFGVTLDMWGNFGQVRGLQDNFYTKASEIECIKDFTLILFAATS